MKLTLKKGIHALRHVNPPKNMVSNILMEVDKRSRPVMLVQLQLATVMSVVLFCMSCVGYMMSVPTEDPLSLLDGVSTLSSDMTLDVLINL